MIEDDKRLIEDDKPLLEDNKALLEDDKPLLGDNKSWIETNKPLLEDDKFISAARNAVRSEPNPSSMRQKFVPTNEIQRQRTTFNSSRPKSAAAD